MQVNFCLIEDQGRLVFLNGNPEEKCEVRFHLSVFRAVNDDAIRRVPDLAAERQSDQSRIGHGQPFTAGVSEGSEHTVSRGNSL